MKRSIVYFLLAFVSCTLIGGCGLGEKTGSAATEVLTSDRANEVDISPGVTPEFELPEVALPRERIDVKSLCIDENSSDPDPSYLLAQRLSGIAYWVVVTPDDKRELLPGGWSVSKIDGEGKLRVIRVRYDIEELFTANYSEVLIGVYPSDEINPDRAVMIAVSVAGEFVALDNCYDPVWPIILERLHSHGYDGPIVEQFGFVGTAWTADLQRLQRVKTIFAEIESTYERERAESRERWAKDLEKEAALSELESLIMLEIPASWYSTPYQICSVSLGRSYCVSLENVTSQAGPLPITFLLPQSEMGSVTVELRSNKVGAQPEEMQLFSISPEQGVQKQLKARLAADATPAQVLFERSQFEVEFFAS